MTYRDMILRIPQQFSYRPEIIHADKLSHHTGRVIVAGMGGSRLAADVLNMARPDLELYIHSDYDVPHFSPDHLKHSLLIGYSHSGNTEETVSAVQAALKHHMAVAVATNGGKLLDLAKEYGIPHCLLPDGYEAARLGIGYGMTAIAHLLKLDLTDFLIAGRIDAGTYTSEAEKLASFVGEACPLVYVPDRYNELGYLWKVIFNETAKIPAFCNRFPELDHNELESFAHGKSDGFKALILQDAADSRMKNRIQHTADTLKKYGIESLILDLQGDLPMEKIVSSIVLAHWTGCNLAQARGVDPIQTPAIELFKHELHKAV